MDVVVAGAGREATRKVQVLLSQPCRIEVVSDQFSESIEDWAKQGRITLRRLVLRDGTFLRDYEALILVMAATDDSRLNRILVEQARPLARFVYCVDDPEWSDFSHPAVCQVRDEVQVALSTGGRSPLMARILREKLEGILREIITAEDALHIQLQERLRPRVKKWAADSRTRLTFLESIYQDPDITRLLSAEGVDAAERKALERLQPHLEKGKSGSKK